MVRFHEYYTGAAFEIDVVTRTQAFVEVGGGGRHDRVCRELVDSRGIPHASVGAVVERIEGLRNLSPEGVADAVAKAAPRMDDAALAELTTTTECLEDLASASGTRWTFDPTLVRGMGYYTGQIFEIAPTGGGSSVAGGGRYDKLVGASLGHDVSACGFSIGFERIADMLDVAPQHETVALLYEPDLPISAVQRCARQLRDEGRSAAPVRRNGKFGAQLGRLQEQRFASFIHLRSSDDVQMRPEERLLDA